MHSTAQHFREVWGNLPLEIWDAYLYCEFYGKLEDKANSPSTHVHSIVIGRLFLISLTQQGHMASVLFMVTERWVFSLKSCGSWPTSHHKSGDNKKCMTDLFKVLWPWNFQKWRSKCPQKLSTFKIEIWFDKMAYTNEYRLELFIIAYPDSFWPLYSIHT